MGQLLAKQGRRRQAKALRSIPAAVCADANPTSINSIRPRI